MNANIVALGRVLFVFGCILCFVFGVHALGAILEINPLSLFLVFFVSYMGWIMFKWEKDRVIRKRTEQEK